MIFKELYMCTNCGFICYNKIRQVFWGCRLENKLKKAQINVYI